RLDHVPLCGPLLRARIASASGPDALAADDEAEVRLPAARRLKVVVAGKGGLFVASALAVQPGVAVERVTTVPARIDADLLVVDDSPGRIPEGVTAFLVNPRPGNGRFEPAKIGEKAPRFEPGLAPDPLVEGVSVADVNVAAAAALRTGPADVVVLASTRGNPLLLRRDLAGERTVALAFPLEATDLGLRAAWPVLVSNVLAWAAEASSDFASAEAAVTQADSDLSARASPPEYTGAVIGAWDRLAASVGDRAARALAAAALVLLMIEFALAQRRPDLA
ncbi:MAG: hypothetical protein FJ087_21655, partial [Deltaproteobacteria bacterium]|nr:hypothetical protein [Deltaproteobacteria bacterium]